MSRSFKRHLGGLGSDKRKFGWRNRHNHRCSRKVRRGFKRSNEDWYPIYKRLRTELILYGVFSMVPQKHPREMRK